jgi:hypothetical protein
MIKLGLLKVSDKGGYMAESQYNPAHAIRLHKAASEIQRGWGNKKRDAAKPIYTRGATKWKDIESEYYYKYAKEKPQAQSGSRRIIIMWGLIDLKF